jgi:integrase/recombinase XerC
MSRIASSKSSRAQQTVAGAIDATALPELSLHTLPQQKWLQHLRSERQLSDSSVTRYHANVQRVLRTMAALAPGQALALQLPANALRNAIAKLHRAGLGGKSLAQVLAAVRSYGRFLEREGLIAAQTASAIRAPKVARKLPAVLDADAARALLSVPAEAALSARDLAMLELFYSSALRLHELVNLNWEDVDLAEAEARVLGKGKKMRLVPIGSHALRALQALHAQSAAKAGAIFLARGKRISTRAVQLRIKVLAKKQGVFQRVYPHLFRHSSASHLLESSGDLRAVQEFLGHADIRTTQIYTHLNFQHLAQVYDAAHPRARRQAPAKTERREPD